MKKYDAIIWRHSFWRWGILGAILPIPFYLPFPINFYLWLGVALYLFVRKKEVSIKEKVSKTFLIGGMVILAISALFFMEVKGGDYFSFYITLLLSLIGIGATAQLIEGGSVKSLVKFTPFLTILLLDILHQSISILLWTIGLVFYFLLLLLYSHTFNWKESLKEGVVITLLALPILIPLFLFFPRIGLINARFGIQGGEKLTGFTSGIVNTSSDKVVKSKRPVFEVEFLNGLPPHLYFRGEVLYRYIKGEWIPGAREKREKLVKVGKIIQYRLKLYPTGQKILFGLDLPVEAPPKAHLTPYYTLKTQKPLSSTQLFLLNSATIYKLQPINIPSDALSYNPRSNPKTQKLVSPLRKIKDPDQRVSQLISLFARQKIKYTLSPPKFNPTNLADDILFHYKTGYCVHIATTFALMARMVGIPSRLVTGYLGSPDSIVKNYLLVRAQDAHAWVEIYTPRRGWFRVDPTKFVIPSPSEKEESEKGNLYLSYLQFMVEKWILNYNSITQQTLFSKLKEFKFLALLGVVLGGFVGMAFLFWYLFWKRKERREPIEKIMEKLEKKLCKYGICRQEGETRHHFFQRVPGAQTINNLYHRIKYGEESHLFPLLREEIKRWERKVKQWKRGKGGGKI